ncbi:hypothetical protein [Variovorax defluvii]|uniref:hypothetical protein n=1 Tax=Variovorax defluvii TaxID=913761 RepID=UPI0031ED36CD
MIVPYAAGGGIDAVARLMAQGLGDELKQSFVVDNRAGAGGRGRLEGGARWLHRPLRWVINSSNRRRRS